MRTQADIPLADEVFRVLGAAFEVYNTLGPGFLEPVYQEALEMELGVREIEFQSQPKLTLSYKGHTLQKEYIADLIVSNELIVELKAVSQLSGTEEAQLINYLKATQKRVGLLLNFGSPGKLQYLRRVF